METVYACPDCGDTEKIQLCFPVWVPANDIEDRTKWEPDFEASPEQDSGMGWCPTCDKTILVIRKD